MYANKKAQYSFIFEEPALNGDPSRLRSTMVRSRKNTLNLHQLKTADGKQTRASPPPGQMVKWYNMLSKKPQRIPRGSDGAGGGEVLCVRGWWARSEPNPIAGDWFHRSVCVCVCGANRHISDILAQHLKLLLIWRLQQWTKTEGQRERQHHHYNPKNLRWCWYSSEIFWQIRNAI